MTSVLYFLPSAIFAGYAGMLAYHGTSGWGWFILGAVLTFPRTFISLGNEKED